MIDWRTNLRPASFRGVPFLVEDTDTASGRRIAEFEFPLRDDPWTQDMGRRKRSYSVKAFVIGDEYQSDRDDLLDACENDSEPGILVHPFYGEQSVRCTRITLRDSKLVGGICQISMDFVESGIRAGGQAEIDTNALLLAAILRLARLIAKVFRFVCAVIANPGILVGMALGQLGAIAPDLIAGLAGVPVGAVIGLLQMGTAIIASQLSPSDTAGNTNALFLGAADAISNARDAAPVPVDPNTAYSSLRAAADQSPSATDPSYGLATMAIWSGPIAAQPGGSPDREMLRQAIVDLVRGNAVLAVVQLYANTDWTSANAAITARDQLAALIDARGLAAADAAATAPDTVPADRTGLPASLAQAFDDLFVSWQQLGADVAIDLTRRAQNLPRLGAYAVNAPVSALVLAQRLYADPSRADELVQLNDTIHPAFMAATGKALAA